MLVLVSSQNICPHCHNYYQETRVQEDIVESLTLSAIRPNECADYQVSPLGAGDANLSNIPFHNNVSDSRV